MSWYSVCLDENNDVVLKESEKRKPFAEFKGKNLISFPDDYTVIDLESTGLDVKYDSIIEVSAIKIRNDKEVDRYSELVYVDEVDEFITMLTGITTEMVSKARKQKEVLIDFFKFIGDDVIVGHNVNFDINLLYVASLLEYKKYYTNDFIDTMRISRWLHPENDHHRLVDLSVMYNIDYSKAHRGIDDCEITFNVFKCIKNDVIEKFESFNKFIDFIDTKRKGWSRINLDEIKCQSENINTENPFYQKNVVITGKLETRAKAEAMQIIANLGGINKNTLVKDTDFLVCGVQDYRKVKDGKSNKRKKAEELILKGKDIKIISENVFESMISDYL